MAKRRDRIKVAALERSPSHLLHGALQLALNIYAEEVGAGGLTQRQFAVLSAAGEGDALTQTDLVRATGVDRSTLADMVARLIKRGYLSRERSAEDARANAVTLTDAGRAAVAEASARVEAADARILKALSSGKRDGFINQLRKLAREVDPESETEAEPEAEPKRRKKDKAAKAGKKLRKKARRAETAPADAPTSPEPTADAAPESVPELSA